jgi:hypothetical protein
MMFADPENVESRTIRAFDLLDQFAHPDGGFVDAAAVLRERRDGETIDSELHASALRARGNDGPVPPNANPGRTCS